MPVDPGTLPRVSSRTVRSGRWPGPESRSDRSVVVHRRFDPDGLLGGAFSGVRRDSSYSSGGKTEDSLGCACVGPPGDDAKAHRTWDRGRRSSSSSILLRGWGGGSKGDEAPDTELRYTPVSQAGEVGPGGGAPPTRPKNFLRCLKKLSATGGGWTHPRTHPP